MKKIMIFAAAFAALVACSKEAETAVNASHFEKGQEVTLTVKAGESSTRVSSALNSGTGEIDFKWVEGDKIKVTVGTESSEFTLIGKGGSASGSFKGTMPADGNEFDVQYPYDGVKESGLASQVYDSNSGEVIPHDKMLLKAEHCKVSDNSFKLEAQYAALRLNLWGTDQTISTIVVTNKLTSATYTLNISPAVTLSTDSADPTPFFVVVPVGNYNFSAEVINDGTASNSSLATRPADAIQNGVFTVSESHVFTTSSEKAFTAGQILNMGVKKVGFTKVYFSKGNLYYDKTEDTPAFKFEDTQYAYTSTYNADHVCRFRWAENSGTLSTDIDSAISTGTSLSGTLSDVFFTNATQTTPRNDFAVNGVSNTWRALSGGSSGEWSYLLTTRCVNGGTGEGHSYRRATINSDGTGVYGLIIYPDNYTSQKSATSYTSSEWSDMQKAGCVFLPAAGFRNGSNLSFVGSSARYLSSTPFGKGALYLLSFSNNVNPAYYYDRFYGSSVRLVSAAQ